MCKEVSEKFTISASIVTYNSSKEIKGVLDSLTRSKLRHAFEVFVVDNGSTDNTLEIIRNEYPGINLIISKSNLGYGSGHNIAIRQVKSKYHFIINPDITFKDDLINSLVQYLEENNNVVLCIPQVYGLANKIHYTPRRNPTIRYLIASVLYSKNEIFKKWNNEYRLINENINLPTEIEFCSGCFMVARTEKLKEVNGFDQQFFLYFEDADLSRRMSKIGKVICNPNYRVIHEGKQESRKNIKGFTRFISSAIKYFNKWGWKI